MTSLLYMLMVNECDKKSNNRKCDVIMSKIRKKNQVVDVLQILQVVLFVIFKSEM